MTASEKRREPRYAASGSIRIRFADPAPREIEGHLLDVSGSGFRMKHEFSPLTAGQVVEFSHAEARGDARVIWNRIVDRYVETGFFVLAAR